MKTFNKMLDKSCAVLIILGSAGVSTVLYMLGVIISLLPYALAIYFFMWLFGAL